MSAGKLSGRPVKMPGGKVICKTNPDKLGWLWESAKMFIVANGRNKIRNHSLLL